MVSFSCFQGVLAINIKSSKCRVNKEYKSNSDPRGAHHDEVVEGSEVPGLDRDLHTVPRITDLVCVDPV